MLGLRDEIMNNKRTEIYIKGKRDEILNRFPTVKRLLGELEYLYQSEIESLEFSEETLADQINNLEADAEYWKSMYEHKDEERWH